MIMKWLVLGLIVTGVWYGFKVIARRNKAKQAEDMRRREKIGEDMSQCAVCGTYVTDGQNDCGKDGCTYPG